VFNAHCELVRTCERIELVCISLSNDATCGTPLHLHVSVLTLFVSFMFPYQIYSDLSYK